MKLPKLILSCFVSITVLVLGTSNVFACKNKHSIIINEYDLYKKMDNQQNIISNQQNSMVKKYIQSAQNLGKKNYNELKSMGYSDPKINLLKKASTSNLNESELKSIGSNLTYTSELDTYGYDKKYTLDSTSPVFKTLIELQYYWKWSQIPIVTNTDGMALNWYTNSNNKLQLYKVGAVIEYCDKSGVCKTTRLCSDNALNNLNSNRNGLYINFPMYIKAKNLYALSGSVTNTLVSYDAHIDDFYTNGVYAQSLDSTQPEFIINNDNIQVSQNYSSVSNLLPVSYHFTPKDAWY